MLYQASGGKNDQAQGAIIRDIGMGRKDMNAVKEEGFSYAPAISAETVGAAGIHMQLLTMPPGARAKGA